MKEPINYREEVKKLVDEAIANIRDGYDEYDIAAELAEGSQLTIYTTNNFVVIKESENCDAMMENGFGDALGSMRSVAEIVSALAFHALRQDILDGVKARRDEIGQEESEEG